MPKRGIFNGKDGVKSSRVIHKMLNARLKELSKVSKPHRSETELINRILAKELMPELIPIFDMWSKSPRYKKKK